MAEGFAETEIAPDRGQGAGAASSNASLPPTICSRGSPPVDSTSDSVPTKFLEGPGMARARKAVSATASAVIPSSCPATTRPSFPCLSVRPTKGSS